ncbi:unnamed protein product [Clonostachys rosea f. rosea IK726]|uniref:Rhodopsin domain-containing protein n=2 Tax=Bionectria ochroleuca TaxID=29856 RepID=A0A0B7K8L7_BIOOC|nr:unnamed protein product [Clonostachys rosea f. rosea IK726]
MGWVLHATPEVEAESKYPTIIAVCTVLSAILVAIVGTRLYIRSQARGFAADDYVSSLSMIFALAYSATTIVQTRYGLGLPLSLRPEEDLVLYTRLGICFFKVALLISYLQLLKGTNHRAYRVIIWLTISLIFLSHLGCTLYCTPVSRSWDPYVKGSCLASGPSFTGYAVVTIVSDIIVAILPLPMLLKLDVRLGKKIALVAIFILGIFTTVCSITRYLQINRIQYGGGDSTMLVLWGTIEFSIGNIASSLPFLAPLFLRRAKKYRSKPSVNYITPSSRTRSRTGRLWSIISMKMFGQSVLKENCGRLSQGSQGKILSNEGNIVKSVRYSIKVDETPATGSSNDRLPS